MNYAVVIIHSFDQWIESYMSSCFVVINDFSCSSGFSVNKVVANA